MNKHLVIGASGQVGEHLLNTLQQQGLDTVGTFRSHPLDGMSPLDIRDAEAVLALFKSIKPGVIYLPAALTNVDYCEEHPEETYLINVGGVQNVLAGASAVGARVVYFSSDYVFDGESGPYSEGDPVNPVNVYGRQKVYAEHAVLASSDEHLIIRTTVVYSWERQGKNFIYRLLNTLKAGQQLTVPDDQIGSPTYAPNMAQAVVELVKNHETGIYHVVGSQTASRYAFALEAARVFGLNPDLIVPSTTENNGQRAIRPLVAGMVSAKAQAKIDTPLLNYAMGLQQMLKDRTE